MKRSEKVVLTAEIRIISGYEQAVMAEAEKQWVASRQEPGCEMFRLHTPRDGEGVIFFYESFRTPADFAFHREAPHTARFTAFLQGKVTGDGPVLTFYEMCED